ncbi:hypothetical protein [Providencia rettgeri]|uniref:hypothetical protein n=1 Tax=Providencia rettgeri TaxID=587 RepID=UPI00065DE030|nr:hypothetical protein [Providencia rettgeri]
MDITILCSSADCSSGVGIMEVKVTDVADISIPEEYQNEILRTAIREENIIKYLKSQGYLVTC